MKKVDFLGFKLNVKNTDVKLVQTVSMQCEIALKIGIDYAKKGEVLEAVKRYASAEELIGLLHSLQIIDVKEWGNMRDVAFNYLYDNGYFEALHKVEVYEMMYGR